MREILFKAKRKDNGEWVEGYYIYHIKRTPCVFGDSVKPEDEQHVIMQDGFSDWNMPRDTVHYDIDPSTLCQYTGLCDKNGRKIWENDIVRWLDKLYKVSFYDSMCSFVLVTPTGHWNHMEMNYGQKLENFDYEVIGNLFDNPELLKGGAE